jgi:hypothetical protein
MIQKMYNIPILLFVRALNYTCAASTSLQNRMEPIEWTVAHARNVDGFLTVWFCQFGEKIVGSVDWL